MGLTGLLSSLLGGGSDAETVGGESYAISSGNVYTITPIFGPSGQAMRFNFDFTLNTRIREPGGTVNPALPRIERHSVNTEVAVTNLDLQRIASFDSNYQIGQPRRQGGGLPIFNQLPLIKNIPVIGYFSLREGKPALRQRSILMVQTAQYPTVGDIANLMLDSSASPIPFAPVPPPSAREATENQTLNPPVVSPQPIERDKTITVMVTLSHPGTKTQTLTATITGECLESLSQTLSETVTLAPGQSTASFFYRMNEAGKTNYKAQVIRLTLRDTQGQETTTLFVLEKDNSPRPANAVRTRFLLPISRRKALSNPFLPPFTQKKSAHTDKEKTQTPNVHRIPVRVQRGTGRKE